MAEFYDVEALMSYIKVKERLNEKRVKKFSPTVAPSVEVAYEDLFAF